jgi:hypothetical protein
MADKYSEDVPYRIGTQKPDEESSRRKDGMLKRRDFIVSAVGVAALASTAAFAQSASGPPQERGEPPQPAGPVPNSCDRARLLCTMRGALAHAAAAKEKSSC